MAVLGKRYRCTVCGQEILCTKKGSSNTPPECCNTQMEEVNFDKDRVPSSD